MVSFADKPILDFLDIGDWERFLDNDPPDGGVRLRLRKKNSNAPGFTWGEALDVALCFGWIDGQVARLDDDYVLQAFTPRRARSPWSQINIGHAERLISEGRMRSTGQAEIDRAKADGRWDAAYRVKGAEPQPDFQAALDAHPAALAFFDSLPKQARFMFIFRLGNLRRPENRERRIAEYIARLERGETLG